jgi:hypothetical protein
MFSLTESLAMTSLPGALPSETALVQTWLREHGGDYTGFDYNVRVGDGTPPPATMPEPWRSQALDNSRKIIDVVAYRGGGVVLLEAKGRINPDTVGQIYTYRVLWTRQHPDLPVLDVGAIGAILDADMLYVLNHLDIPFFVYPQLAGLVKSA